jgi:hypothetical protein
MNVHDRIRVMTEAVASNRPLPEVAKAHGIPLEELEVWATLYGAAKQEHRRRTRRSWQVLVGALVAAVVAGGLVARKAWAGTCASVLPAPLVTMCPDEPALASEVNSNMSTLRGWILAPPAAVNATSTISASGQLSAHSLFLSPALNQSQGTQVFWNQLSPGLGQTEIMNNRGLGGGGIAFYDRASPSSPSAPPIMTLQNNKLGGSNTALCLQHVSCEDSPLFSCGGNAVCPTGKYVVGVTDGTGCAISNKLRCCGLQLVACP